MIDLHSKEFGAFDLIGKAFWVFSKHPGKYFGLLWLYLLCFFAIGIVAGIVAMGLVFIWVWSIDSNLTLIQIPSWLMIIGGALAIVAVIAIVYIAIIYAVSLLHLIHQHIQWNNPSLKSVITYSRSLDLSKYFGLGLVKWLYLFWLSLLLLVPGIIYSIYWLFTSQIFVIEGLGYPEALDRSKKIVEWRWWNLFGKMLVIVITVWLIYMASWWVLSELLQSFDTVIQWQTTNFVASILTQIVAQILSIIAAIYYMMIYINWKHIFLWESSITQETVIDHDSILDDQMIVHENIVATKTL